MAFETNDDGVLVQRPTFDMNVLRAALDPDRAGHEGAVWLFELAADGKAEIGVPPQGHIADLGGDMTTLLAQGLHALLRRPGVVTLVQLGVPSPYTFPGSNLFPEQPTAGFAEAWSAVAASWNGPGRFPAAPDRWYVESHVARERDVLVTDDVGMQTMCERLRDAHNFDIIVESLADYAARFRS